MIKKHFNKNLVISEEEEERFQLNNSCCICDKLFDIGDNKVRDNCHVTGKYRSEAHWSCNVNPKLSKKVPVIVPINTNLVFIDSMQFMNPSLDSLVKNLS